MEINKKIIKELKDCLDEFNLNEIEYSYKDTKIKVSKNQMQKLFLHQNLLRKNSILISCYKKEILGNKVTSRQLLELHI